MINVEVMYTDESTRIVSANVVDGLPKRDVLMMFVHADPGSYRIYGDDFYIFGFKSPDEWFCTGWNEYDDRVRVYNDSEPNAGLYTEVPIARRPYPAGFVITIFAGGQVDNDVWQRVIEASEGIMLARLKPRGD